jgi:hypothetical protein
VTTGNWRFAPVGVGFWSESGVTSGGEKEMKTRASDPCRQKSLSLQLQTWRRVGLTALWQEGRRAEGRAGTDHMIHVYIFGIENPIISNLYKTVS